MTEKELQKKEQEERRVREFKENPNVIEILKLKREEGMSDTEIWRQPTINCTRQQIHNYVQQAIALNMIKKEEIDTAYERRKMETKNKILKARKNKKTYDEMKKSVGIKVNEIRKIEEELIQEGLITEEGIDEIEKKQREKRKQEREERKNRGLEKKLEKGDIRSYINLYYEKYRKASITNSELLSLKSLLAKITIEKSDVREFVKCAISIQEYQEALDFVRIAREMQERSFLKSEKQNLEELEKTLNKAIKVQRALNMIKRHRSTAIK